MRNKMLIFLLALLVAVLVFFLLKPPRVQSVQKQKIQKLNVVMPNEAVKKITEEVKQKQEIEEEIQMPEYDIKLSKELQRYTYLLCQDYSFSYELILALLYQESKFNHLAVNKNSNGSYDLGISQQNSKFVFETASRAGIKAFDPMNPKHSIKVCIVKLAGLRDYWINQGYDSQESLFWLILGSYNRGVSGMKRYIKYNGTLQTDYALKVAKWKEQLEVEGGLD